MAYIGSSPLGLTFESTRSAQSRSSIRDYKTSKVLGINRDTADENLYRSIFGNSLFSPFVEKTDIGEPKSTGAVLRTKPATNYHSSEAYDTSISALIDYTRDYKTLKLLASDFAYLKNLGVFPNNRLMIARRFAAPVRDDLTSYGKGQGPIPLATLISWVPDGEDFIDVTFGEDWRDVPKASFQDVLNEIGKEVKASADQGTRLGDLAVSAANKIPLPGFMEGLQYQVLNKMGLSDVNSVSGVPGGNPNLIREAKQRSTLDSGDVGSGLKAKFSVKMVVEYEQKFINGVDPTLVYYDIITNILSFGTSEASFQFSGAFAAGVSETLQDFISGDVRKIMRGIKNFIGNLIDAITETAEQLLDLLINPPPKKQEGDQEPTLPTASALKQAFVKAFAGTIGTVIGKYRIRIQGIANALAGAYSTPWHITIGNPKKPLFSSGDMYTTDVSLKLGPILAFNDLPSSIKVEFTLTNARNLGAQEIFNKFNASGGRTYKRINMSFADVQVSAPTGSNPLNIQDGAKFDTAQLDNVIKVTYQEPIDRDNLDVTSNLGTNTRR